MDAGQKGVCDMSYDRGETIMYRFYVELKDVVADSNQLQLYVYADSAHDVCDIFKDYHIIVIDQTD